MKQQLYVLYFKEKATENGKEYRYGGNSFNINELINQKYLEQLKNFSIDGFGYGIKIFEVDTDLLFDNRFWAKIDWFTNEVIEIETIFDKIKSKMVGNDYHYICMEVGERLLFSSDPA